MKSEFELIELLKKKIPRRLQGPLGIGDDAGVFSVGVHGPACRQAGVPPLLVTTDAIVEGVDFKFGKISPEMAGRKALAVNLSDIAAMGGEPVAFVAALGIPKKMSGRWIERFYGGMMTLARKYRVACVGGDISRAQEFFASIALIGRAGRGQILTRGGAKSGDCVAVTGTLGGSILGRHFRFEPRIREGMFLARRFRPHAMIDISDGLVQDLGHISKASKVGVQIDLDKIPVSRDAEKLAGDHQEKALEYALTDGEDFELLFTIPPSRKKNLATQWKKHFPRLRLSWIGRVQRGREEIEWFWKGKRVRPQFKKSGFTHF